jgi:dimethylhistidine N-methyltransferase
MLAKTGEGSLKIKHLQTLIPSSNDGEDIIQGLTQTPKTLPPKYFYDYKGSQLFEQICNLPEYYPTRTEAKILQQYSAQIAEITGVCQIVELGSGSSTKTRFLLDSYANLGKPWEYVPIDISADILKTSALQLQQEYSSLSVTGLVGTYEQALTNLELTFLPQRMLVFLGSTLGNFSPQQSDRFLTQIRTNLQSGDYFLLGIDLQKPVEILEAAYNDSQGVTALFNLNMLSHLNWRFQGNFQPNLFNHQAIYNQCENQIEMYLHCQQNHQVNLDKLDLTINFTEEERVLTEISRKFNLEIMKMELKNQGLIPVQTWTDSQQWFGLILSQVV